MILGEYFPELWMPVTGAMEEAYECAKQKARYEEGEILDPQNMLVGLQFVPQSSAAMIMRENNFSVLVSDDSGSQRYGARPSPKMREAMVDAQNAAVSKGFTVLNTPHLLYALSALGVTKDVDFSEILDKDYGGVENTPWVVATEFDFDTKELMTSSVPLSRGQEKASSRARMFRVADRVSWLAEFYVLDPDQSSFVSNDYLGQISVHVREERRQT